MNKPTDLMDINATNSALINFYNAESALFFSTSDSVLLAQPPYATLLKTGLLDVSKQANESLRLASELGYDNPIVVGAIPYNTNNKSFLRLCTNVKIEPKNNYGVDSKSTTNDNNYSVTPYPVPHTFMQGVQDAIVRFSNSDLKKVVLSRLLEIDCELEPNIEGMLQNLLIKNPNAYTFAINLSDNLSGECNTKKALIGSSPELLIARKGKHVYANPLAGSEPRCKDPEKDRANAQKLLVSKKDRYEHALVIKAIKEQLEPLCKTLTIPAEPSLVHTETMWHLGTCIDGEIKDLSTTSLDLALAIHPTPAVCGYPQQKAADTIADIESFNRNLFAGMVGWCNAEGDGEWAVTIRCAEIDGKKIKLFAGAGIVPESDPEKELNETGAKFKTMLNALGLE